MPSSFLDRIEKSRRKKKSSDNGAAILQMSVFNTGAGDNGIVEPEKAVGVVQIQQGLAPLHEGETVAVNNTGGMFVKPNPMTAIQVGPSNMAALQGINAEANMFPSQTAMLPGFKFGTQDIVQTEPLPEEPVNLQATQPVDVGKQSATIVPPVAAPTTPTPVQPVTPTTGVDYYTQTATPKAAATQAPAALPPVPLPASTPSVDQGLPKRDNTQGVGVGVPVSTDFTDSAYNPMLAGANAWETPKEGTVKESVTAELASGEDPIYEQQTNKLLNAIGRTNQENIAAGLQEAANAPGLTEGALTNYEAQLLSNAAVSRADALSDLGSKQLDLMYKSKKDIENEATSKEELLRSRIGEMITSGKYNLEDIYTDASVLALAKEVYGDIDGETYVDQINKLATFTVAQNTDTFSDTADSSLIDYVDTGYDLTDIMQDSTYLSNKAKSMGYVEKYENLTPEDKAKVDNAVKVDYELATQSDFDQFYQYVVDNVFKDLGITDTPTLHEDLKAVYLDAYKNGSIVANADGTYTVDQSYDWPWNDPTKSYGNYYTLDGKDILYDANGEGFVLNEDGTETPLAEASAEVLDPATGKKVSLDSEYIASKWPDSEYASTGISQETVNTAWNNLSDKTKALYYDDNGAISDSDYAKFIEEQVIHNGVPEGELIGEDGQVTNNMQTINQWNELQGDPWQSISDTLADETKNATLQDTSYQLKDADIATGKVVFGVGSGATKVNEEDLLNNSPADNGYISMKGVDGKYHLIKADSDTAKKIWSQMSLSLNNGEPMTMEEFSAAVGDGEDYLIDANGDIVALTEPNLVSDAIDYGMLNPDGSVNESYDTTNIASQGIDAVRTAASLGLLETVSNPSQALIEMKGPNKRKEYAVSLYDSYKGKLVMFPEGAYYASGVSSNGEWGDPDAGDDFTITFSPLYDDSLRDRGIIIKN